MEPVGQEIFKLCEEKSSKPFCIVPVIFRLKAQILRTDRRKFSATREKL
jgi:hypothetical protein